MRARSKSSGPLWAIAVVLGLFSLITNPLTALPVAEQLRPFGPVTIGNWREHRQLHAAAAFADVVDEDRGHEMTSTTRRLRCEGSPLIQTKTITMDSQKRIRCYIASPPTTSYDSIAWYFDERGVLRFLSDHGAHQETFLSALGEPLWAWRKGTAEQGPAYGLHLVNAEQLTLHTTAEAARRYRETEPNCRDVPDNE